jgi:hypothetical protein
MAYSHCLRLFLAGEINMSTNYHSLFMHLKSFPKGANAICTYLWSDIMYTKQNVDHPASRATRLLVQADNCVGENKNKYVFAFLAFLVLLGVYNEVEMNFLIVGHTHDIVDSMFGLLKSLFFQEGEPFACVCRLTLRFASVF